MDLLEPIAKNKSAHIPPWFFFGTLGILLMLISALAVIALRTTTGHSTKTMVSSLRAGPIRLDTQTSRFILRKGIPALDRSVDEDDPFTFFNFNWTEIYWRLAANIANATPQEILKAQLPLLALVKPKPVQLVKGIQPPVQAEPSPESPPSAEPPPLSGEPTVFIYHSHTTESYIPNSGKDHTPNAKGDIVLVGSYLQKLLETKYGIKTIHNEDIHDTFPFRDSYKRSQVTAMKYLKEYPSIKVVLDIHRNATPGVDATASVHGQDTATISLVVGSDKMGLPHPNWRKNLTFAKKLEAAMNHYYPGLCDGLLLSDARYNQHLHDHSVIVEFGDQNSTLEKVYRAVDYFAEVLVYTMNEETKESKP